MGSPQKEIYKMTNEQYIQVAEKVWGWRCSHHHTTNPEYYTFITEIGKRTLDMESLRSLVNSWPGFGRTVEAMTKRGLHLIMVGKYVLFRSPDESFVIANRRIQIPSQGELIEATHLYALEAIDEK